MTETTEGAQMSMNESRTSIDADTNGTRPDSRDVLAWQPIKTAPERKPVLTKIDDERGVRNEAILTRHGRLWYTGPDQSSMYVYYTPTHWKALEEGRR